VVLTPGPRIGVELVPDHVRKAQTAQLPPQFVVPPEGISFKDVSTDFEKGLIESALEAAGGVQKRAAELLHIKPTTLNEMIKRHDIRPRRKRNGHENGSLPEPATVESSAPSPAVGPLAPAGAAYDDK
jgi:DNA-binding NtrC family response regulator